MLVEGEGVRALLRPAGAERYSRQGPGEAVLNMAGFAAAEREVTRWPGYQVTRLAELRDRANRLGLASIWYKDERARFGLKSFKALGGPYAVYRVIARQIELKRGIKEIGSTALLAGTHAKIVRDLTVTCATDGNHGRAVAWAAKLFGCHCVIVVHETVSAARMEAIARYGAEVVRVPGNYDDAVRHASAVAAREGWFVVSDTSYPGYRDRPIDIMHGYGVMAAEIVDQLGSSVPTHVFIQAGVGALAAAMCARLGFAWGPSRPRTVIVEPTDAACFFASAQAGRPVAVKGDLRTVMAGLACGEVSELAWEIVSRSADAFLAIDDRYAIDAVRALAMPGPGEPAIVAGETGAAGMGALLALCNHPTLARQIGLGPQSSVLLLGSEGDTDPEIYRGIVGASAEEVLKSTPH